MLFLYNFLTLLYLPIALAKLIYKKKFSIDEFYRLKERFGFFDNDEEDHNKKIIWIHAVSVGEVNTSINLIKSLKKTFPNKNILVTTTTETGSATLMKEFKEGIFHQYLPFDIIFFIEKFLNYWKPECLILIETEIWPNLINKSSKKNIPIILLNGRLSDKSLMNYKKIKSLFSKIFMKLNLIIAQSEKDKRNFVEIGAKLDKVQIDSSLKFDALEQNTLKPSFDFEEKFVNQKKIITCASTHPQEEEILYESFKILNDKSTHLVLVPRHPERANLIGSFLKKEDVIFSFLFNGEKHILNLDNEVTIVNEIGHLNYLYSISDLAFIGGTLIEHGGQNFLEPLKHGIPLSAGSSVYNFQEIADQLSELKLLKYGNSAEEIASIWHKELASKDPQPMKERSFNYIASQKGSLERSVGKIKEFIL